MIGGFIFFTKKVGEKVLVYTHQVVLLYVSSHVIIFFADKRS